MSPYPKVDEGTNFQVGMDWWASRGVPTPGMLDVPKIALIDPQNIEHIKLGIDLCGFVCFCYALPLAAQTGDFWDVPRSGVTSAIGRGGHFTVSGDYNSEIINNVTWGGEIGAKPEFVRNYCVGACCAVSRTWLPASGNTPSLLSWNELNVAQKAITG